MQIVKSNLYADVVAQSYWGALVISAVCPDLSATVSGLEVKTRKGIY
jgi:hypothetical protein